MSTKGSSSTSSSSTSAAETGTRRFCPLCKKRMSTTKHDKHSTCINCREIKCDVEVRCSECNDWSIVQMEDYLKHRKMLDIILENQKVVLLLPLLQKLPRSNQS